MWYEGSSVANRRFYHTDERGSITAITNSNGNAIAINKYDEFGIPFCPIVGGAPNCADPSANLGRFQFTGQVWLPELGAYSYKARVYSYNLGRFMQTDPIGYGDGLNLYAYAANDPFNNVDSDGLAADPLNPGGILVIGRRPYTPPLGANIPNAGSLLRWQMPSGSLPPRLAGSRPRIDLSINDATPSVVQRMNEEEKACSTDPLFRNILSEPQMVRGIKEAVALQVNDKDNFEYGFNYNTHFGASSVIRSETRSGWFKGLPNHIIGDNVMVHTHKDSIGGLSWGPGQDRGLGRPVIAIDVDKGRIFCYNPK